MDKHVVVTDGEKCCSKCGKKKPLKDFLPQPGCQFGVRPDCKACSSLRNRQYRSSAADKIATRRKINHQLNKEEYNAKNRAWYAANRAYAIDYSLTYYDNNKEKKLAYQRDYAAKNSEALREYRRAHMKANRGLHNARNARRKAIKRGATPPWADTKKIAEHYRSADLLGMLIGEWHHVDHIVPLKGPRLQSLSGNFSPARSFVGPLINVVQGLHCESNMQVMLGAENIRKSNRHWPDMPHYVGLAR
jgi:hypothetical protein